MTKWWEPSHTLTGVNKPGPTRLEVLDALTSVVVFVDLYLNILVFGKLLGDPNVGVDLRH